MTHITNIQDKKLLTYSQNLERIIAIAENRFSDLKYFRNQNFSNNVWKYRGKAIIFSAIIESSKERAKFSDVLESLIKAFVIDSLWKNRLRNEPLSSGRVASLARVGDDFQKLKVESLEQINTETYRVIWSSLTSSVGKINNLNSFIDFLRKECLLPTNIDTISSTVLTKNEDFKPVAAKMPKPDLVKAIIELKNKVEANCDFSDESINDLLCVYTQAFQYGLGLRIGEVLRLSKDCLFYHEGKLLCRVWTEKGCEPIPRYVLGDWRELILEVHTKLIELTSPHREFAAQIENGTLKLVDDRIAEYETSKQSDADELLQELDLFLNSKAKQVQSTWKLKRNPEPSKSYELTEVIDFLPIGSTAKNLPSVLKAYQAWGLNIDATPVGKGRNTYSITGQSILDFVKWQTKLRSEHVTEQEFLSILHGRQITRQHGRDKDIFAVTNELPGGTATCFTFAPDEFKGKGRAPTAMSRGTASELLVKYAYALLNSDEMDIASFGRLFPELPFMYSSKKTKDINEANNHLDFSEHKKIATKVNFETNPNSPVRYSITGGYGIKKDSIKNYIYSRFFEINHAILNELNDIEREEKLAEIKEKGTLEVSNLLPIEISSKSFKTEQNVSDYLFLRPMRKTGTGGDIKYIPYIPEILDYNAVAYFFKGNDRMPSAFERFGVNASKSTIDEWQSHQGRHWRTTSLFRSGAQKSLVNKLMGRKDVQGKHYDHNTGTERAKQIREAMQGNVNRFIGAIPNTIADLKRKNAPQEVIDDLLKKEVQTISYTPEGMCTRSLELNPCEYHLRCMIGKNGKGCKHFIVDLADPSAMEPIKALRDQTLYEIERLVELKDATGNISIDKHLEHNITLLDNADSVIGHADKLLANKADDKEFLPFKDVGSFPDDCPFQCGNE